MSSGFKIILAAIVAVIVYAVWPRGKSDQVVLTEARAEIHGSCMTAGTSSALPAARLKQFCDCSADKSVADLGIAGVRRLKAADTPSASDQELVKTITAHCVTQVLQ